MTVQRVTSGFQRALDIANTDRDASERHVCQQFSMRVSRGSAAEFMAANGPIRSVPTRSATSSRTPGHHDRAIPWHPLVLDGLLADHEKAAAAAWRTSPVAAACVSPAARGKADGQPVHSFATLLADLANLTRNAVRFGEALPTIVSLGQHRSTNARSSCSA
jgi:hypothetical protein